MDKLRRLQTSSHSEDSVPLYTRDDLALAHHLQDPYPSSQPSQCPQPQSPLTPQDPEEGSGSDPETKNHWQARDEAVSVGLEDESLKERGKAGDGRSWEAWPEEEDSGAGPRSEVRGAWAGGDRSGFGGLQQPGQPGASAAARASVTPPHPPTHSLGLQSVPQRWPTTGSSSVQSQPTSLHHSRYNVTNTADVMQMSSFPTAVVDCREAPGVSVVLLNAVAAFLSIFCCPCTGIAAFVVAIQVQLKKKAGHHQEARQQLWCSFALVIASLFLFMPTLIFLLLTH